MHSAGQVRRKTGTQEQFFKRDVLIENGISYNQALQEVVDILVTGIMVK